jgi:hypothetical protein
MFITFMWKIRRGMFNGEQQASGRQGPALHTGNCLGAFGGPRYAYCISRGNGIASAAYNCLRGR